MEQQMKESFYGSYCNNFKQKIPTVQFHSENRLINFRDANYFFSPNLLFTCLGIGRFAVFLQSAKYFETAVTGL